MSGLYDEESATRTFTFRLRRLAELAKRSRNWLLVTENDLETEEGVGQVADFLRIRTPVESFRVEHPQIDLDPALARWGVESYEKHLFYIRGLRRNQ